MVRRYDDLSADLLAALAWTSRRRPGLPRFVLGHSNGGQVALRVVLDGQAAIAGLIVSNPVLRLATRVPRHKLWIGSVLRRYAPGVTLRTAISPERLTSDPVMQASYGLDALRHDRISPPLFFGMVEGGPLISARAARSSVPVLMILGGADPVIDPEESRALLRPAGQPRQDLAPLPRDAPRAANELGRERRHRRPRRLAGRRIGPSAPTA